MNLKDETLRILAENGKAPSDVIWCGLRDGSVAGTWVDFAAIDYDYENGFGTQEVSGDLVIVGLNWWLERHEYDGSEWWEFKTRPLRKRDAQPLLRRHVRRGDE